MRFTMARIPNITVVIASAIGITRAHANARTPNLKSAGGDGIREGLKESSLLYTIVYPGLY